MTDAWAERLKAERVRLAAEIIDAPRHYRIMTVGRKANGQTDIVACLERALRNLGHHVLGFDLKLHNTLVENPYGHQGGRGPVYFKLSAVRGAVERFRPEVVIFLAGGLTLRDDDMAWLKGQGAVVIGITLSDPDVAEYVRDFAAGFDFHTTNALAALEIYEEAGVPNTLHFPFGVDRAFVTQDVPGKLGLDADVICLGHATAHPVRDGVMSAVHERLTPDFTVRAYGRGWSLPESRPVEGLEVLQASRAGVVHVNFPMTRAGFTNVKCGVFETVASGGLLVTKRFDEMGLFFDYGSEIGGYEELEDLPDLLRTLLDDRDEVDRIRERAFKRLTSEHLYEHRWLRFFEQVLETTARRPEHLGERRAREIEGILSADHGRARLIAVSGFYGARNVGDDLIMEAICGSLERQVRGGQAVVIAQSPKVVEAEFGRQAVSRAQPYRVDEMLAKTDALVVGGGGLWHDYTFRRAGGLRSIATGATISIGGVGYAGLMAHLRDIPFHVAGLGVGPLTDPDAKRLVRFLSLMTESLTVRDEDSRRLLLEAGVPASRVQVAPDVVYSVDLQGETPAEVQALAADHFLLAVNLRPWERAALSVEQLAAVVAGAVRRFAATLDRPLALVFAPLQEGATYDRAALATLAGLLEGAFPIAHLPEPLREADLIGALETADLVLSMRLHCCLLSHRLGTPAVGLAYDPKLTMHFEELGRGDLAVPLDTSEETLAACLTDALRRDRNELAGRVEQLSIEAVAALAGLAASIDGAPRRDIVWGIEEGAAPHEVPAAAAGARAPKKAESPADAEADLALEELKARVGRRRRAGEPVSYAVPRSARRLADSIIADAPAARRSTDAVDGSASARRLAEVLVNDTSDGARERAGGYGSRARRSAAEALTRHERSEVGDEDDYDAPPSDVRSVSGLLAEADAATLDGDLERAVSLLEAIRQLVPDEPTAMSRLLQVHLKARNWKRLTFLIHRAKDAEETRVAAFRAQAQMYLVQGKTWRVQELLDSLSPDDPARAALQGLPTGADA